MSPLENQPLLQLRALAAHIEDQVGRLEKEQRRIVERLGHAQRRLERVEMLIRRKASER